MTERNSVRFTLKALGVLLALAFLSLAARAQAFVSAKTGVDVGVCPVTAPCRSITYSLSQAGDGGTVNVVDSGERCQALRTGSMGLNVATSPEAIIRLIVLESQFSGVATGVNVSPDATGVASVNFENRTMVNNKIGLHAEGSGATVRVSNSTISENGAGLATGTGATLLSRGNNTVEGNSINGAFTGTFPAQ